MGQRNRFHVLLNNDKLNIQDDYIFFDTETKIISETKEEQMQDLKLGWAIYWNRPSNKKEYFYFEKAKEFWDFVELKMLDRNELIIYAHNTEFDFKVCNGYMIMLIERNWYVRQIYIEQKVFILELGKGNKTIKIYDTMNYIPSSLKQIGEALKYPKMEIDFKKCTKEELSEYCKNDTEIVFEFIKKLIEFLKTHDLTRLRPTAASLSMNCFRHKFYDMHESPIYVHAHDNAIKLERESYRGGITDCFRVGNYKDKLVKLDINSMYPYVMRNFEVPTMLVSYDETNDEFDLREKLIKAKNDFHVIADCIIELPEEYAYLLTRFMINKDEKAGFIHGRFNVVLTTPEINFVLEHGKIISVSRLALYKKAIMFKKFVDFFYKKRLEYDKNGNMVFGLLCKLFLNSLYGKFAMKDTQYETLTNTMEAGVESYRVMEADKSYTLMHIGNMLFKKSESPDNAYDSFVAISSMITAYARMYLVDLILKVGRDNVYYVDTDCLIMKADVMDKVKSYIDKGDKELGKLKNEGFSEDSTFYRPKFYIFDKEFKCKGVKKIHTILSEDENSLTVEQEQFEKFKTSLRKGSIGQQRITHVRKTVDKNYDKGHVIGGIVRPYHADDVTLLSA